MEAYISLSTFSDPSGSSLTYQVSKLDKGPIYSWLKFNSINRTLNGIPSKPGSYEILVTGTNDKGKIGATSFTITVIADNR